jgi:hypothetical protein
MCTVCTVTWRCNIAFFTSNTLRQTHPRTHTIPPNSPYSPRPPLPTPGKFLYCLDREGKMRTLDIDTTEALFKLALERKDYTEVMRMVRCDVM